MSNTHFDPLPVPPPKPELERLTCRGKRHAEAQNNVCCTHFKSKECHDVAGHCEDGCKWEEAAWERLAQYEETGLSPQQIKKLIPAKVTHEATLYQCGTCPTCHNVVSDFEKWGDKTILITVAYCKYCGQALDWEGFSMEPKTNAVFCPNYIHETGTCYFEQNHHCDYIENCKFMPPSGSSTPDV